MRFSIALIAIAVSLPAAAFAQPKPRWTFCVAAAKNGADVWISDVFLAERNRLEYESAFRAMLERKGAARPDAQCPEPLDDKTQAVNAEFEAEQFNRDLGATLHAAPASEFLPRR
jgi:hypothetical protein